MHWLFVVVQLGDKCVGLSYGTKNFILWKNSISDIVQRYCLGKAVTVIFCSETRICLYVISHCPQLSQLCTNIAV